MSADEHNSDARLPLKWRCGAPDGRSAGSLSQFVRDYLCQRGGSASRRQLLKAIQANSKLAARLERGQGLPALLRNMRYSGFVVIEGETVRASRRTRRETNE